MSVRVKTTFTCDKCGVKAIEYYGRQCSSDPVVWPKGWSRLRFPFNDTAHYCCDCTAQREALNNLIDNWRLGGVPSFSMGLYGIWADRGRLVTNSEGS
jgi:hypothetical protein